MGKFGKKNKFEPWKRAAIVHFVLFFLVGLLAGFAPMTSERRGGASEVGDYVVETPLIGEMKGMAATSRRLIITVTPITARVKNLKVLIFLTRLAHALKMVPPPLLWIIVERRAEPPSEVVQVVEKMGVLCRRLVSSENFTSHRDELDHQINVALRHIRLHQIAGVVHFAQICNVYDLKFFDELRRIQALGSWARAVCRFSHAVGWPLGLQQVSHEFHNSRQIHISSFAFNSSLLWDPQRWPSSPVHFLLQNSTRFVEHIFLEDETTVKGIRGPDCSEILMWQLQFY